MTTARGPELLALIPEPFLTVRPGDLVTIYLDTVGESIPGYRESMAPKLLECLEGEAPDVTWGIVVDAGFAGVIHVARDQVESAPRPEHTSP